MCSLIGPHCCRCKAKRRVARVARGLGGVVYWETPVTSRLGSPDSGPAVVSVLSVLGTNIRGMTAGKRAALYPSRAPESSRRLAGGQAAATGFRI